MAENIVTNIISSSGVKGIIGTSPEYVRDSEGHNIREIFATKSELEDVNAGHSTTTDRARWNNSANFTESLNLSDLSKTIDEAKKVNFKFAEEEKVFKASPAASITLSNILNWNSLLNTSLKENDLVPYLTKLTAANLYQPKGSYLTEHLSLSNYAKLTDLNNFITEAQLSGYTTSNELNLKLAAKLDKLVSGVDVKTLNGQSILGHGNLSIEVPNVQNTLSNNSSTDALSALQGKILNDKILNCASKNDIVNFITKALADNTYIKTLPDLSNYATKSEVNQKLGITDALVMYLPKGSYLTLHLSLDNYATKNYVMERVSEKLDTLVSGSNIKTINGLSIVGSGNVSLDIPEKTLIADNLISNDNTKALSARLGYVLSSKLNNYALKSEISDMLTKTEAALTYITEHQSLNNYALKSEIPNISNLAEKSEVAECAKLTDILDMAKISDIPTDINDLLDLDNKLGVISEVSYYEELVYVPKYAILSVDPATVNVKADRAMIGTYNKGWHLFYSGPMSFFEDYNAIYIPNLVSKIKIKLTAGYYTSYIILVDSAGYSKVSPITLVGKDDASVTIDTSSINEDTWLLVEIRFNGFNTEFTEAFIVNGSVEKSGFSIEYTGYPEELLQEKLALFTKTEYTLNSYVKKDLNFTYTELLYITSNYLNKRDVEGQVTDIINLYFDDHDIDTSEYVTKPALATLIADYPTSSDLHEYTALYYQPKGNYITEIPEEYITETELLAKNYLTLHQDISGKSDVGHTHTLENITDFPTDLLHTNDVKAWAKAATKPTYTYTEVGAAPVSHTHYVDEIVDFPSDLLHESDIADWAKAATRPVCDYSEVTNTPTSLPASDVLAWAKADEKPTYTYSEVGAAPETHEHSLYAISTEVDTKLSLKQDTISDLETIRSKASTALQEHQSLSNYYTKSEADTEFLKEHQSLADYATQDWVETQGYITNSALDGYATENWVSSLKYLTQHQSLDNYYSKDYVYTKTEAEAKFLQTHQSLDDYYTKSLVYTKDDVYTKSEADAKYLSIDYAPFVVVSELPDAPEVGQTSKVHLVVNTAGETGNTFNEYLFVNNSWELLGEFKPNIDLTPYLTTETAEATYSKIVPTIDKGSVDSITITSADDNKVIKFTANAYFTVNSTGLSWIGDKLCMSGKSYMLIILDGVAALNVLN